MMRWLTFAAFFAACYFGGSWLLDNPGEVSIAWFGYDITLHVAMAGLLLLLFSMLVAFVAVQFWRMATWPARRRMRRRHRTFTRGLEQLTRGVAALAMGNEALAEDALKKARTALPGEPLPQLLTAQLLQRQGKQADAEAQFKALMQYDITAELATRRLIEQHVARQEWHEAIQLTEKARETMPKDHWLLTSLIDLYARRGDTVQMLALTEGWQWQSPLTKQERHRYSALAYYLAARREPNTRIKERNLRHAVGYAPDFLPAAVDYAYFLMAEESPRRARKWLLSAWKKQASPLLIAPILASLANEPPKAQTRLLKPFLREHPTAAHAMLAARHAIQSGDAVEARKALEQALLLEESKEACLQMAELERKLRNDETANRWMARALEAPQSETWVCSQCGARTAEWHAHCQSCTAFDTLRFERPEARITSVDGPAFGTRLI